MADLVLYQYGPAWGLPSFDPKCNVIHAYLRFAGRGKHIAVENCNNPAISPSGALPVLRDGETLYGDCAKILKEFRARGESIDYHLTGQQLADISAYTALVEEKLAVFCEYNFWLETANYEQITHPLFAQLFPTPLNYIIPKMRQTRIRDKLKRLSYNNPEEVYVKAHEVVKALADRLGDGPFFFGHRPSTLDAIVFGHLAVQFYAPMPVNTLASIIASHPNLVRFLNNILASYFQDVLVTPPETQPWSSPVRKAKASVQRPATETVTPVELKSVSRTRWAVGLSLVAVAVYAVFYSNLLTPSANDDDE